MRLRGGGGISSVSVDLRIRAVDELGFGAFGDETSMAISQGVWEVVVGGVDLMKQERAWSWVAKLE